MSIEESRKCSLMVTALEHIGKWPQEGHYCLCQHIALTPFLRAYRSNQITFLKVIVFPFNKPFLAKCIQFVFVMTHCPTIKGDIVSKIPLNEQ